MTRIALAFMAGALAFSVVHALQGPPAPSFLERWSPAAEQPLKAWPHHWTSGACDWIRQTCTIT